MKCEMSHEMYILFMFYFLTHNKMYMPRLMIAY